MVSLLIATSVYPVYPSVKQVASGLPAASAVHLHAPTSILAQPAPSTSKQPSLRQPILGGLLKVAALDASNLNWKHSSGAPQQLNNIEASSWPFADAFGHSLTGGVHLLPRLLAAPSPMWHHHSHGHPCGASIITGGFGALGSLLAVDQLASARCRDGSPSHVIVVGRNMATQAWDAHVGAVWRQSQASGSMAQLTISMCDLAVRADLAGLVHRLATQGIRVGSITHAAGVLRVSEACLAPISGSWSRIHTHIPIPLLLATVIVSRSSSQWYAGRYAG